MVGSELFSSESTKLQRNKILSEVSRRMYEVEIQGFLPEEIEAFKQIICHLAEIWSLRVGKNLTVLLCVCPSSRARLLRQPTMLAITA